MHAPPHPSPVACQVDRCNALASIRVNSAEHLRRDLGVDVLEAPVDLAACAARVGLLDEIHVCYPVSEVRRPAECDSDGAVRLFRNKAVCRQSRILHLERGVKWAGWVGVGRRNGYRNAYNPSPVMQFALTTVMATGLGVKSQALQFQSSICFSEQYAALLQSEYGTIWVALYRDALIARVAEHDAATTARRLGVIV